MTAKATALRQAATSPFEALTLLVTADGPDGAAVSPVEGRVRFTGAAAGVLSVHAPHRLAACIAAEKLVLEGSPAEHVADDLDDVGLSLESPRTLRSRS